MSVPRPRVGVVGHVEQITFAVVTRLPQPGEIAHSKETFEHAAGGGAVAAVLIDRRPAATVIATDVDERAVACARSNGVDARRGDLFGPLPAALCGRVDVMTAVVPYVPTEELHLLPRDVLAHEPARALDGGPGGTAVLERAARGAARWLRPGGTVLLELGGDQADGLSATMVAAGLTAIRVHRDDQGRDRAIEARRPDPRSPS